MAYHNVSSLYFVLVCLLEFCVGQYVFPEIKLEAFTPRGLRISIPADEGLELFAFHGKVNKPIVQIDPGEFSEDVTRPSNGRFTYFHPFLKLKEGDTINYWVFVQYDQYRFRKVDQSWKVDKLVQSDFDRSEETCSGTMTKVLGKTNICSGDDVINYKFTESPPDSQVWQIEQFLPYGPDWEYVIYKNEADVIGVENNVLRIKPKIVEENAMKDINIEGCTRQGNPDECAKKFISLYNNPIISGRMISKDAFCFANITIKAKLPQGDWIFPEIYLEDVNDPKRRILLAYARGNKELTGNDGNDIGGKTLFAGPFTTLKEPDRSKYLASYLAPSHVGEDWHVFTVKWTKDQIDLYIDGKKYGLINSDALKATQFDKETMVRLVLGVGVGGVYEFPDGYKSGSYVKPWRSLGRNAVRDFLSKKDNWEKTWEGVNQLLIEFVTITAL